MRYTVLVAACLLAVPWDLTAQVPNRASLESLDETIRLEMERGQVPGAAVVVVHGQDVPFARSYGVVSTRTREPVTAGTLFMLGSVTKVFTAATILSLAEDGLVDLNAQIAAYLPGLPPRVGSLTLHQLLSHTGGLRDAPGRSGVVDEDELTRHCESLTDATAFTGIDGAWSYSNSGYSLAGCVAAAVAGTEYSPVVRDRVLGPIGMDRSTFDPLVAISGSLARGHEAGPDGPRSRGAFPSVPYAAPAGMLMSNLDEMARLATVVMTNGRGAYLDGAKREAVRLFLGVTAEQPPQGQRETSPSGLGELVGEYGWDRTVYEIVQRGGRLWIIHGSDEEPLERLGPDKFRVTDPMASRPFPSAESPRINFETLIPVRGRTNEVLGIQYYWRVYPRR